MQSYEKPVIKINDSIAEGVYASSGSSKNNGPAQCGSSYMSPSTYHTGSWTAGASYKDYYGCFGCSLSRPDGCALTNGEYESVVASNNGNYSVVEGYSGCKPSWENGVDGNSPVK